VAAGTDLLVNVSIELYLFWYKIEFLDGSTVIINIFLKITSNHANCELMENTWQDQGKNRLLQCLLSNATSPI